MSTTIIMPRQGQSVESCIIGKWHKKRGDLVEIGDVLFSYETDKSAFEETAKTPGVLLEIYHGEGDDVPCLEAVCVIGEPGEKVAAPVSAEIAATTVLAADSSAKPIPAANAVPVTAAPPRADGRLKISPRARNLAERLGVDAAAANPTGPGGRIIEFDIRGAAENTGMDTPVSADAGAVAGAIAITADEGSSAEVPAAASAEYTAVPLTTIRKTIARAMHKSLSEGAQLTLNASFDMSEINAFRARVKSGGESVGLSGITINDVILYAVSRTILAHPDCNAHFTDGAILRYNGVNLGVAVDTPRGLMVPVIRGADKLSLSEISRAAKDLAKSAQEGTLIPDSMRNGTITITNLGSLGIESFTPVINPPQTCILGVNTIETRVKLSGGEIKPYSAMTLSLTFDHRALDGAPAARFLQSLIRGLENFSLLLAL